MARRETSTDDSAHDVLAAEAYAMPAPDPRIHHGPVSLPGDPTGIAEPHDVLAAEEFAMPAPSGSPARGLALGTGPSRRSFAIAGAGVLLVLLLGRRALRRD